MNSLESEQSIAQKNAEKIASCIPSKLAEREDNFGNQIQRAKISPAKKLLSLYSFMNELYSFVSQYTPCKKGCTSCCYYKVDISEIEIAYIEKHTKIKKRKVYKESGDYHGKPCPFLKNGACSIYHARPFLCRRHITLTSTNVWCKPAICHDEKFTMLSFSGIDDAYNNIREESESLDFFDIRQVFD